MNEWVKTLLTSTVVAGVVSWLATSYKIEQEFHSRQGEQGYQALVEANAHLWLSRRLKDRAEGLRGQPGQDQAIAELIQAAQDFDSESYKSYVIARYKIAAFGDKRVVEATSDYWSKYQGADAPCADQARFRADARIYVEIRKTWGVGGDVSDEVLAPLLFDCSLTAKSEAVPAAVPPP